MPNHFHLLLREVTEGGIALFMQKLTTGYTMYFNKRHERSGSLFEGTYKARHADEDCYLRYLISYIHLNPIKLFDHKWKENGIQDRVGAERFLEKYEYSSYLDYFGKKRLQSKLLEQDIGLELFESLGDFKQCTAEWLTYSAEQNKV
jgi:putative transposase